MKNTFKGKRGGGAGRGDSRKGGYRQGGFRTGFKPRFGQRERPDLHDAICSKCGDPCQVPFRPTGSKPIYCKKCFNKDGAPAPKRFGERERPSFAARPAPAADTGKLEARLAAIEKKLDTLIEAILEDIDGDEDDEEGDDENEK